MTRTYLRRAVLAAAGFSAAVTLAGCGVDNHTSTAGGHSPTTASPSVTSGQSSSPGVGNSADVMFAQLMIPHHQQAVQMADLAVTRATDPQVKQLAAQIKAAQGPEIATMTRWLTAWGMPTPTANVTGGMHHGASPSSMPSMDHGMPGMMSDADMSELAAATGANFDKQFLTMMIAHHEGAITMAKDETKNGAHGDAKALARQIVDDQQAEIHTMNKILDQI